MASDFTPGQWKARSGSVVVEDENGIAIEKVARCFGRFGDPRMAADARLIAKAPEMARLIADIEESLTADGTYRLLREACQKMLREIGSEQVSA